MSTDDDEALTWLGDNDERLTAGPTSTSPIRKRSASPSLSPDGAPSSPSAPDKRVVGQPWSPSVASGAAPGTEAAKADEAAEADGDRGISSGEGIALGVLGGIYLLFSAAWIVTALGNPVLIEDPLGSFMFVFGLWLAALAPATWFTAVLAFGRNRSFFWRFAMLALGAAVVIPWPYLLRGA